MDEILSFAISKIAKKYNTTLSSDEEIEKFKKQYRDEISAFVVNIQFIRAKNKKKQELKQAKEDYLKQPIAIGNKLFYGDPEAYNKYLKAYNLGLKKGVDGGNVILLVDGKPKWVYVTKEEIEEYFLKQENREYHAEYYLGKLLEQLEEVDNVEDVEKIKWVKDEV